MSDDETSNRKSAGSEHSIDERKSYDNYRFDPVPPAPSGPIKPSFAPHLQFWGGGVPKPTNAPHLGLLWLGMPGTTERTLAFFESLKAKKTRFSKVKPTSSMSYSITRGGN